MFQLHLQWWYFLSLLSLIDITTAEDGPTVEPKCLVQDFTEVTMAQLNKIINLVIQAIMNASVVCYFKLTSTKM